MGRQHWVSWPSLSAEFPFPNRLLYMVCNAEIA